jgi:hypothetical protein
MELASVMELESVMELGSAWVWAMELGSESGYFQPFER